MPHVTSASVLTPTGIKGLLGPLGRQDSGSGRNRRKKGGREGKRKRAPHLTTTYTNNGVIGRTCTYIERQTDVSISTYNYVTLFVSMVL